MRKTLIDEVTQDGITITKTMDGGKNTVLAISGQIKDERDSTYDIVDIHDLLGNPKSLRFGLMKTLLVVPIHQHVTLCNNYSTSKYNISCHMLIYSTQTQLYLTVTF